MAAHTLDRASENLRWSEGISHDHRGRPQQDSNLRTRLRRALLYIALTSANMLP
jgi:hypothetical protein